MRGVWRLRNFAWRASQWRRSIAASVETNTLWRLRRKISRPHSLPAPLVVSLTSYPARFDTLAMTLKCLLSQIVRPDHVILWIADQDMSALPSDILILQEDGLEIRPTPDIGSYKKIIPTLQLHPDAFIATADDDVYYSPRWLAGLIKQFNPEKPSIICYRAHRVLYDDNFYPLPYDLWQHELRQLETAPDICATGVGGVLYFPGCFDLRVSDVAQFQSIAKNTDDLWLFWMVRLAGYSITILRHKNNLVYWPGSQKVALYHVNAGAAGRNDKCIQCLYETFGSPCLFKVIEKSYD